MRVTRKEKITGNSNLPVSDSAPIEPSVNGQPSDAKTAELLKPPRLPLWEFLADEERDTDGTSTWVYRIEPVLDRKESEHAIAKKKGRFSRDDILRDFGSGVFKLFVNDSRGKTRYSETVSFHNPSLPPKLDLRDLAPGDPRNERYWEMLSQSAEKSAKDVPADITTLLNTVVSKSGAFDPAIAALWERTARERDALATALSEKSAPPDLLGLVRGIKELLPNPAPPSLPPQKSEALEIISALKGLQTPPPDPLQLMATAKELFVRDIEPVSEPPRNHIAELDQILSFAQKLASIKTPNSGDRSGWEVGLDYVKELGGPLIQTLNNFMALRSQGQRGAMQPAPGAFPVAPMAFDCDCRKFHQ